MALEHDDLSAGKKIVRSLKDFVETIEASDSTDEVLRQFRTTSFDSNLSQENIALNSSKKPAKF